MINARNGTFPVPRVAPGPYTVCSPRRVELAQTALEGGSWLDSRQDCVSDFLAPDATLKLVPSIDK